MKNIKGEEEKKKNFTIKDLGEIVCNVGCLQIKIN